ncbi:Site-specific DNA recombinase [Methylobacterium phyllostachyos]|uniref:Site-specific DNA recombinase n=1 Tax=Methylobacterium phyllostachyos TaxID=582672 RepID=A0A1H0KA10_9HYPH|nr:recombinase family protein [Methylobacterium phyllostachyos]SDO52571.1 Site-specific DNA recombinase [Methylobacterium phyllostachyos]
MTAFVSYLRVSTERQGRSGLGLEAQRRAVADFLAGGSWRHVAELVEVESGSRDNRPRLSEAMALCRLHGATLVIAKLDRLSRDAAFLLNLQKAGVRFVAADMPEANELVVGIMAVVAQAERKMISARTKAALAAAKARGARLGNPGNLSNCEAGQVRGRARQTQRAQERAQDLAPVIAAVRASGATSLRQIATALDARGIPAARGGAWSAGQVRRVLQSTEEILDRSKPHPPGMSPIPKGYPRYLP